MVSVTNIVLCRCYAKPAKNKTERNGHDHVAVKLELQKWATRFGPGPWFAHL